VTERASTKGLRLSWQQGIRGAHVDRAAKYVALILSTYMSAEGAAFPSLPTLAVDCLLSKRSVEKAVGRLELAGWLSVTRRPGRGNRYRATFPPTSENSFASEGSFAGTSEIRDSNQRNPRHKPAKADSPEGIRKKEEGDDDALTGASYDELPEEQRADQLEALKDYAKNIGREMAA
jgi:DNA-binding transcriptional MocR family regulator